MLKAPPLIPWYSKIGPKKGHKYVKKYVWKSYKLKKVDNGVWYQENLGPSNKRGCF